MKKKKRKNLCLNCPVRGKCCYYSTLIEGYNIILENQPCSFLDTKTGLCKDYKNRKKNFKFCLDSEKGIGKGAFPKECLYLTNKSHLEPHPKVFIEDVIDDLSYKGVIQYNLFNNISNIRKLYGKPIK